MSVTTQGSFATQEALAQAVNTAISTAGAGVLTAAGIVGTVITRTGPSAAYTDTTDTAAAIFAALSAANVGEAFELTIKNTVAFACTLAADTGVVLSGLTVIPPLAWGRFLVTVVSATSVTIVGLATGPLAAMPAAKFTTIATDTTITAAANTLTGAKCVVYQTTAAAGGGIALTTRTAAEMFADIPNCSIGFTWVLVVVSQGGGTVTVTAPGGGGVTLTGTATVATKTTRTFVCTFTSTTAVTFQSVSVGSIE